MAGMARVTGLVLVVLILGPLACEGQRGPYGRHGPYNDRGWHRYPVTYRSLMLGQHFSRSVLDYVTEYKILLDTFYDVSVGPDGLAWPATAAGLTVLYHRMGDKARDPRTPVDMKPYYFAFEAAGRARAALFYGGIEASDKGHRDAYNYAAGMACALTLDQCHGEVLHETGSQFDLDRTAYWR